MESPNNFNPNAQALVVYKDSNLTYLYREKVQLEKLIQKIDSQPFDINMSLSTYNAWGPHLRFTSIASVYTLLLRHGFRLSHESKAHIQNKANYFVEVWIKD